MIFGKYINKYYIKLLFFYIIGIIALLLVDWIQLYLPEFLGNIVSILENSQGNLNEAQIIQVLQIVINIVVVAIIMCIGRMGWRFALFTSATKIQNGIRDEMFLKAERLSPEYYQTNKVGSIMAWFSNDLSSIEECCGFGIVMIGDALFLGILTIGKMLMLDWVLSVVAFIPIFMIVIWGAICEKVMTNNWDARQKAFDDLYDFTQENFTGIRVIKAFVKEIKEIGAFKRVARKNYKANFKFAKMSVLLDVVIEIIIAFVLAGIIGIGGWFVYQGIIGEPVVVLDHVVEINAAKLITFVGYFDTLIWPMIALGQIISMHSRAKASLNRITAFLDTPEVITNIENPLYLENCKGKIEFKNFTFVYPGFNKIQVNNVSLTINPGELVGVVGRIGSGKTTLFNCLSRLYNVERGQVFIDDKDIMDLDFNNLRENIAYCPQDNFLFSASISDNIAFSSPNNSLEEEDIIEAAKFADVDNNIREFKDGYATISGERGVTLSGGQKQRISIARAYAKKAPIMILDDSVSAVDVKTEETIIKNIREQRKGQTTIVVASRVSTVRHLDKIIVLDDGNLEAFGTHYELMKNSPTYQKMVYLQALEKSLEEEGK